jgi:hypothetical protein
MLVEAVEGSAAAAAATAATPGTPAPLPEPAEPDASSVVAPPADVEADTDDDEAMPAASMTMQDGIRAVQHAFAHAHNVRWPMYVRQARQFLRGAIEGFDERKYGFASVVDLLRAAGKENILRVERDRQGAVRVFPGLNLLSRPRSVDIEGLPADVDADLDVEPGNEAPLTEPVTEVIADLPIVDAQVAAIPELDGDDEPQPFAAEPAVSELGEDEDNGPQPGNELVPPAGSRRRRTASSGERAPRTRAAKTARPRTTRARKTTRGRGGDSE